MNDEKLLCMALTRISGLSLQNALTLYRAVGSATDIFNGLPKLKQQFPEASSKAFSVLDEGAAEAQRRAEQEAKFCEDYGIDVLCLGEDDYPSRLAECEDAPLVLYYRGAAQLNAQHVVSIVGTRRCTEHGKDLCRHLTAELAHFFPGLLVVSGLAYGIDVNAHRGSMEAGLPTVGVLAHGLDRIYPPVHRDTAKQMLRTGGLLTEYMTETSPEKGNFVRRNRIIAGLADATIVVESAYRGGAMITARMAFEYGRQVYACPGRMSDQYSEGCNKLIRENVASLLTSIECMADDLGWLSDEHRYQALNQPLQAELFPNLSEEERIVVEELKETEGLQADELSRRANMPIYQLTSMLFDMEMRGIVRTLPGGVYRLVLP